jgi:uncharacterized membrane protein
MNYAIPILLLLFTIVAFFGIGRGHYADFGLLQTALRVVAALPLLVSGIFLHFIRASTTASIIPPIFPAPLFLVFITGIFEIAGAIGLFVPRLRRAAALCIATMMVAIIPANVYAAGRTIDGLHMPGIVPRTAMQFVYIVLVLLAGYGIPGRFRPKAGDLKN